MCANVLLVLGVGALLNPVVSEMINGTVLVADPYPEAVYIQQKPSTPICAGIVVNETTVYTSALCEVGTAPLANYYVVEAPYYEAPPSDVVRKIKTVQRGKRPFFDLKVITLEEPFVFCETCNATKVTWVETFDDYINCFDEKMPGVVFGFGPPLKGGTVSYRLSYDRVCQADYESARDPSWPGKMPIGSICIYQGTANVTIPSEPHPRKVTPGTPGDDSIGSLVKLENHPHHRTLGIVIKATENLTLGWGSLYILTLPFEPDGWTPAPPTTTTISTSATTTVTTTTTVATTTTTTMASTTTAHRSPSTPTSKSEDSSVGLAIQLLIVFSISRVICNQLRNFPPLRTAC